MTSATQSKPAVSVTNLNNLWKAIGEELGLAIAGGAPFELKVFPKPGEPLRLPKTFSPQDLFPGSSLTIWRGRADGNGLDGEEAIYEPADLVELKVEEMAFNHFLTDSDSDRIGGETKMGHVLQARKSGLILPGGRTGVALWKDYQANGEKSRLEWLRANRGITWFDLPGVVLRNSFGDRYIPYFSFRDEVWNVVCGWLSNAWGRGSPSGVLPQVSEVLSA